jgi:hypothetical protein
MEFYLLGYMQKCLLSAGFLLGLIFNPEDGGDMLLQYVCCFQQATWHYIVEDKTLHNDH